MAVKRYLVVSVLLILLLMPAGCGGTVTSEEFLQSYHVRSGTVIEVFNPNGDVKITGWNQDNIEIAALKESIRGQSALDEVDINIDIADKLIIQTLHPDDRPIVTVTYDIKVPADLMVGLIESSNGSITLQDVSGNPELFTSNGSISATGVNGIVFASTSNGNIIATGVRSLAGLITSNGSIEADLPTIHDDLEIKTSNGSIKLSLAPSLRADLDVSTSNGSISFQNLNIDDAELEQTSLQGTMNGGGSKLEVSTSNGSIELLPLR